MSLDFIDIRLYNDTKKGRIMFIGIYRDFILFDIFILKKLWPQFKPTRTFLSRQSYCS